MLPDYSRHYLFTHTDFSISKNGHRVCLYNLFLFSNLNQIIQVNATADRMKVVELHEGEIPSFNFTYSVTWVDTSYPFTRRMDLYKNTFFGQEMEIHWLSIVNSIVLVVLLTG